MNLASSVDDLADGLQGINLDVVNDDAKLPPNMRVVNYVATANLNCTLDLIKCTSHFGKFGRRVMQSCVVRSEKPGVTTMVMANGKLQMCGADSPEAIMWMAWLMCYELYERGLISEPGVSVMNVNIENIVCALSIGFPVNIELFYDDHNDEATYHPEKISPVQWYPNGTGLAIVVYKTGEAIITGNRTLKGAIDASKLVDWTRYALGKEYRPFVMKHVTKKEQAVDKSLWERGHKSKSKSKSRAKSKSRSKTKPKSQGKPKPIAIEKNGKDEKEPFFDV